MQNKCRHTRMAGIKGFSPYGQALAAYFTPTYQNPHSWSELPFKPIVKCRDCVIQADSS